MTIVLCALLLAGSYVSDLLKSSIHVAFTFHLSWHSNMINHFFCDILLLLALSCSSIYINEIVLFMLAAFNVAFTLLVILTSYLLIFVAILRMCSAKSRKKDIFNWASHLTTFFYLLWHSYLHVLIAQLESLHGHWQNGICVLYHGQSHAEPSCI